MSCKKTFHEKRVMCNTQFFTTLCKMVIKKNGRDENKCPSEICTKVMNTGRWKIEKVKK